MSILGLVKLENVDVVSLDALYKANANYLDGLNYSKDVASVLADAEKHEEKGK